MRSNVVITRHLLAWLSIAAPVAVAGSWRWVEPKELPALEESTPVTFSDSSWTVHETPAVSANTPAPRARRSALSVRAVRSDAPETLALRSSASAPAAHGRGSADIGDRLRRLARERPTQHDNGLAQRAERTGYLAAMQHLATLDELDMQLREINAGANRLPSSTRIGVLEKVRALSTRGEGLRGELRRKPVDRVAAQVTELSRAVQVLRARVDDELLND